MVIYQIFKASEKVIHKNYEQSWYIKTLSNEMIKQHN